MSADEPLFRFEAVRVAVDNSLLLDGINAEVPARGISAVVGPSGAGKSTLLRLCNRLEVPTTGRVLYRGRDLSDLDPLRLRRQVGMVFQRPALFGGTVDDNLGVAAPASSRDARVQALGLAALDAGYLARRADSLSGGEAQRVCLSRTLLTGPEALRDAATVSNMRHVLLLRDARGHLERAASAAAERRPEELILVDLHAARARFDEVIGRRMPDDVLHHIFQRFCIGK